MPLRVRLTCAYAAAVIAVLILSGLFVYVRLHDDLDDAIDAELRARATAAADLVRNNGPAAVVSTPLEDAEESFVQVLDGDGVLLAGAGTASVQAVSLGQLDTRVGALVEAAVADVDGSARMLVREVATTDGAVFIVVGQSLVDREDALRDVRNSFAVGGPVAVLVASALGYWLAGLGLRPVEEMRRTAGDISARRTGQRLPLPPARDEMRRLGETLNDMLGRLERSFERERRFVSDASHELRTPITVAKTELEGALRSGDFGPDVGEAITAAIEECDSLWQLADDLLVVARADEGGLDLLLEPLAVRAVLDGVRNRFVDRAAAHGRSIVIDVDGDPAVLGDRSRLRQALGNVVDNALRHGAGTITLQGAELDGAVRIDVSDSGTGFTEEMASHAFERFARGDHGRRTAGAGLGLAIVAALVAAHGGRATIVDRRFVRITLPVAGT
ncbi:MAG: HAMP domain-containing protein [Acidimicrobiia bacterium]|nr:HAMP domain-containing protein [Acidimicrobiia bacterium]